MGLFSRRKTYVNVTNSVAIPFKDRPRAIIEGTSQYIWDSPRIHDTFENSMVKYQLNAIDGSIVMKMKQAERWVKKHYDDFRIKSTIETTDEDKIREIITAYLENKYKTTVKINYVIDGGFEFRHTAKQILQEDYGWKPSENTFQYKGETFYIEDVFIEVGEDTGIPPTGFAFKSGKTPFRNEDRNRPHNEIKLLNTSVDIDNSIITIFRDTHVNLDKFDVVGVFESYKLFEKAKTTIKDASDNIKEESSTKYSEIASVNMNRTYDNRTEYSISENVVKTDTIDNKDGTTTIIETIHKKIRYKNTKTIMGKFDKYALVKYGEMWMEGVQADAIGSKVTVDPDDVPLANFTGYQYQVEFTYEDTQGVQRYKNILINDDRTPELTKYLTANDYFEEYIPRIYYRYNMKWLDKKHGEFYKDSKKFSKKIGYDYGDMQEMLEEQIESNEDKIASIYMNFGIDMFAKTTLERDYLRTFFIQYINECLQIEDKPLIHVGEQIVTAGGVKLDLSNKKDITYFKSESVMFQRVNKKELPVGQYSINQTTSIEEPPKNDNGISLRKRVKNLHWRMLYQESETHLISISIKNPSIETHVMYGHSAKVNLATDGAKMLVPLSFNYIRNNLNMFKDKEALLYAAMYIEVSSYVVVKKKWYETFIFKVFVFAASIALSIYTGGGSLSLSSIATTAATNLAIGVIIELGMKLLSKLLPMQFMKIIGIAITVIGALYGVAQQLGQVSKAFTILNMKATHLVSLGQKMMGNYMQQMQVSFQEEQEMWQNRFAELEEITNEIAPQKINIDTSGNTLQNSAIFIGESIDEMINRTINTNIGMMAIDYIHQSVQYTLTLPTIRETLQYNRKNHEQYQY